MSRRSSLGGLMPVGAWMSSPTANPLITLSNGSQWLIGGAALAASGYPVAATLAHLRAHRFTRTATATSGAVPAVATNGSGTFVAVVPSDGTNVYTSTDGGATWVARPHDISGGYGPCAVVWTGARFVAVGNNGTTDVKASTSTDGITWTLSTVATGLTSVAAGTVDIAWDGSAVAVLVPNQSTANTIYTSPTGLSGTWVARTVLSASVAPGYGRIGGGALGFAYTFAGGAGTSIGYSTDHGATWATATSTAITSSSRPMVSAGAASIFASGTTFSYSSNLSSWAPVAGNASPHAATIGAATGGWAASNAFGDLLTTADGISWVVQVVGDTDATKPSTSSYTSRAACVGNTSIVLASGAGADYLHYAISTPTSANGVGGVSGSGHWRIK